MGQIKNKRMKMKGYGETPKGLKILIKLLIAIFVFFLFQLMVVTVDAGKIYNDINNVEFVYNYDGDTINVNIRGWPHIIGQLMPIRVNGVDTPEIKGKCIEEKVMAHMAKQFVYNELVDAETIDLVNPSRGKYYRIVADVQYDGKSLTEELLRHGYAYEYDGDTKSNPWCE